MFSLRAGGSFLRRAASTDPRSAEEVKVHLLFFLLLDNLLLLLAPSSGSTVGAACSRATTGSGRSTTASAATCTAAHLDERVHADIADHLRHKHGPVALDTAASCLDEICHARGGDLGTVIMQDEGCVSAEQLVKLLLGKLVN